MKEEEKEGREGKGGEEIKRRSREGSGEEGVRE